jgi:O-antigen/teichoic acid export membrane protein
LLWTYSGGLLTKGAVLVTTLIAARALVPRHFGEYIGLSAAALLASGLWDLGLTALLVIELSGGRVSTRAAVARVADLRARSSMLWLGVVAAGMMVIDRQHDISLAALALFAAYSAFASASNVCLAILQARFAFRAAAFASGAGRWVTAAISLLALPTVGLGAGLAFFGAAAAVGEVTLIAVSLLLWRLSIAPSATPPSVTSVDVREVLTIRRSLPFAANGLLAMLYNRLDVLIVSGLALAGQLTLYAPASRFQDALYLIPGSLQTVAFPIMSRVWNSAEGAAGVSRLIRRFTLVGLAISIPMSALCCIFTPQLLTVVLGGGYLGATAPTRILVWFLPIATVSMPMMVALAATGHAMDTTRIFGAAAFAAISMHLALDWHFGAVGGAIASLTRDPCALIATIILSRRAGLISTDRGVIWWKASLKQAI